MFKTAKVTFSHTQGHWQSCHSIGFPRHYVLKPLGMQFSIFRAVPSQDILGGLCQERHLRKNGGMAEVWHQLVKMGWQSIWSVGASACGNKTLTILSQKSEQRP